jgi:hypothetical protein
VTPLLLDEEGGTAAELAPLGTGGDGDSVSEAAIQKLVHEHPKCLPIAEIDPIFCGAVPVCTELKTPAGAIDNFMVTPSGLPVLVECKSWRNPEGRREVVGQILDYAKELSRWSSSDLQREARRRVGGTGDPLLRLVREAGHEVDEIDFNDALTLNLRRGRFLLLIVGDGIRERVEAIGDYLQAHAGLHFTLGLVELPIYRLPDGRRLVVPRILAHSRVITRTVVAVPEGFMLDSGGTGEAESDPPLDEMTQDRLRFWTDFVSKLQLDDPEQPVPKPGRQGYVAFMLPAPSGSCWITVFRNVHEGRVGLFLSYTRNSLGERTVRRVVDEEWEDIREELGGTVQLLRDKMDRLLIQDEMTVASLALAADREQALDWLRRRSNDFINALRPRIRAAAADLSEDS